MLNSSRWGRYAVWRSEAAAAISYALGNRDRQLAGSICRVNACLKDGRTVFSDKVFDVKHMPRRRWCRSPSELLRTKSRGRVSPRSTRSPTANRTPRAGPAATVAADEFVERSARRSPPASLGLLRFGQFRFPGRCAARASAPRCGPRRGAVRLDPTARRGLVPLCGARGRARSPRPAGCLSPRGVAGGGRSAARRASIGCVDGAAAAAASACAACIGRSLGVIDGATCSGLATLRRIDAVYCGGPPHCLSALEIRPHLHRQRTAGYFLQCRNPARYWPQ